MKIEKLVRYLREYNGRPLAIMEVCGSHTAAIAKHGIKDILSDKIKLISGPGCPVCVTPSAYIDRLIEISMEPNTCVVTFGDLLRVPGSKKSLNMAKGEGADVKMVYSPMDTIKLAKDNPEKKFVFAAVGFETTAPVYTLLMEQAIKNDLDNIFLLTALKTMPKAIEWLLGNGAAVDGFIAPGHVCAITGSQLFEPIASKYHVPFAVSGFEDKELIMAIYGLVKMIEKGESGVNNYYSSVVEYEGNTIARKRMEEFYSPCDCAWRGMGIIPQSGLRISDKYKRFDAGSMNLDEDIKINKACMCGQILMGKMESKDCPLFKKVCTPSTPAGACMVSYEGSCYQNYING